MHQRRMRGRHSFGRLMPPRSRTPTTRIATNRDHRALPAYTVSEAAHYLNVPATTLGSWVAGSAPLTCMPTSAARLLSFFNLAELHVIAAVRRTHGVRMPQLRSAIDYLRDLASSAHDRKYPLLSQALETDGVSVFLDQYGELTNISQRGQVAMREVLGAALKRIDRDAKGVPVRLFPYTRPSKENAPSIIAICPGICAGRPVIVGTGLSTQIIAERYKAGESIRDLAQDYERAHLEIEEAIRCELDAAA